MKKTWKRTLSVGITAALAAGMLAGCGGSADTAGSAGISGTAGSAGADGEKVLTFGCQNYGDGLVDPTNQTNAAWNLMRYGVGEALFKFNDNMEAEPWLAESYEVTDDHLTWTIKLRDDVKFSDGCEMTATKVK